MKIIKKVLGIDFECTVLKEVKDKINEQTRLHGIEQYKKGVSKRFPLSPSQALNSTRDMYLSLQNYYQPGTIPVDPFPPNTVRLFELGHLLEDHFVEHIQRAYEIVDTNQRTKYGEIKKLDGSIIPLSGEFDFTIKLPCGEVILCDSKSVKDYPFKMLDNERYPERAGPKEGYIAQMNLYMHGEYFRKNNINRAWIFHYAKNTSDICIIEVKYNAELCEKVIQRFQEIYTMYENKQLPDLEYYPGQWQADYSQFKSYKYDIYDEVPDNKQEIIIDPDLAKLEERSEKILYIMNKHGNKYVDDGTGIVYHVSPGAKGLLLKRGFDDGFR